MISMVTKICAGVSIAAGVAAVVTHVTGIGSSEEDCDCLCENTVDVVDPTEA